MTAGSAFGADNSTCPRCGASFRCGMTGGDEHCWCAAMPIVDPLPLPSPGAGASCYCPACLAALKAERSAGVAA